MTGYRGLTVAFLKLTRCCLQKRWIRTLKEECLYLHDFQTLEEARQMIGEFIEAYNREWLIERHGHRTPADVRQALTKKAA